MRDDKMNIFLEKIPEFSLTQKYKYIVDKVFGEPKTGNKNEQFN